jgi:hypothetical protein
VEKPHGLRHHRVRRCRLHQVGNTFYLGFSGVTFSLFPVDITHGQKFHVHAIWTKSQGGLQYFGFYCVISNKRLFPVFSKLRAYGSHSVLFLNIKSYAGGTRPWNRKNGNQDINDGLIEVVAIDNLDLAILHAGEEANVH